MKNIVFCFLLISLNFSIWAQNCLNAGFESGTVDGYQTYLGEISPEGVVDINIPGPGLNRHTIVHRNDDPDPIAAEFCDVNSVLPMVPEGGGQYAMRLGDSNTGAQADRVLLTFTVTEELTYFFLQYAVVLNDPHHHPFEQPRFELRISDENGDPFPCGEYFVRAAADLPGFEYCEEGWRVRTWTAAGFELQSYLGQQISIEILTTDCSQGAHAGYAYIDASCAKLEISVDGYCPDSEVVNISVPEGFSDYVWSTGDTTNVIQVENPVPGTSYSVTVTSATGCDVVLDGELPPLDELPTPDFDPHPDEVICSGESIWLTPTGDNLGEVFSVDFGYAADSFLVSPINPTTYTFISEDEYGCSADTLEILVDVGGLPIDTALVQPVACGLMGSIELVITQVEVESVQWSNGQTGMQITDLEAGSYDVTVTSTTGCEYTGNYNIFNAPDLSLTDFSFNELSCDNSTLATIEPVLDGGAGPFSYAWSNGTTEAILENVGPGTYGLTVTDAGGCSAEGSVEVEAFPELSAVAIQEYASCIGGNTGSAVVAITGGIAEYSVLWDDPDAQQNLTATNLAAGEYNVTVTDANGCIATTSVEITETQILELSFEQENASCSGGSDGTATVVVNGGAPNYLYTWSDAMAQTTATAQSLSPGTYTVTVVDANACINSASLTLSDSPDMLLDLVVEDVSCYGYSDGAARVEVNGGTPGYSYAWTGSNNEQAAIDNLSPGEYTVMVVDANGCVEGITFNIAEPEPIAIYPGPWTFPDCDNDLPASASVEVEGGTPAYYYEWETGDSSATIWTDLPGMYTLTVTDANNCLEEGSVEVKIFEFDLSEIGLTVDEDFGTSYLCLGDSIQLHIESNNELRSILWSADAATLDCVDCPYVTAYPIRNTPFEVDVIDINGCPGEDATYIVVNHDCGVYIPNAFSPNGDGINDYFYVAGSSGELMIKSFRIFDRWGAQVFEGCSNCPIEDPAYGWDGKFNGKEAASGVYVYAIELAVLDQADPVLFKGDITLVR